MTTCEERPTSSRHATCSDTGLYDPADEHDACGVGVIAAIDGEPRREIVLMGIEALKSVWHRGAVDADGKTGDGAGIHVQIPHAFFEDYVRKVGQELSPGKLGIGQIFLPRTDLGKQEVCRVIVEREILNYGYTIYGWRQVPVNIGVIGEKANATRPEIEQIMIANSKGVERGDRSRPISTSSAAASSAPRPRKASASSISARCPAARSSTRACSWRSS